MADLDNQLNELFSHDDNQTIMAELYEQSPTINWMFTLYAKKDSDEMKFRVSSSVSLTELLGALEMVKNILLNGEEEK
jgi:hypothetical protein